MFNKSLFNKGLYNKKAASDDTPVVSAHLFGSSVLSLKTNYIHELRDIIIRGHSAFDSGTVFQQDFLMDMMKGSGTLVADDPSLILYLPLTISVQGRSNVIFPVAFRNPIKFGLIRGSGNIRTFKLNIGMHTYSRIRGTSSTLFPVAFQKPLDMTPFIGTGDIIDTDVVLSTLINCVIFNGKGELEEFRIGAMNEGIIVLKDINLASGQELIIDMDTLEILLNGELNVNIVDSNKSDFFELYPGINRLKIETPGQTNTIQVRVDTIWSNRWL